MAVLTERLLSEEYVNARAMAAYALARIEYKPKFGTIMVFVLLTAATGYTVFETISPTGILSRALIYGPGIAQIAGKGAGLGLAIVRDLADALHGESFAENVEGNGARVGVTLPATAAAADLPGTAS